MSAADAQRITTLESRVYDLAERYRGMIARVAALEDHLVDFQRRGSPPEARIVDGDPTPSHPIPALQGLLARP